MKPDSPAGPIDADKITRAHLKDPRDRTHVMHRYPPRDDVAPLVQWFWIPVWSVPPGSEAPQKVLQYPACLLVVSSDYARFYGVTPGLSTTTLRGDGWAVGLLLTPAAGFLLAGEPVAAYTDRHVDLVEVLGPAGSRLVERVRQVMEPDPHSPTAHGAAMDACADTLRGYLPVDPEGALVDRVVAYVEDHPDVVRVAQICAEVGLSERALQRLAHRRLGLTPKWLVQRRRLHEAADRLRQRSASLADVAAVLGYADQAHFSRDFSRVTTMTPSEFAALHDA